MNELETHPLDVMTACRKADLPTLKIACAQLRKFIPFKQLHVATARTNFRYFRRALGEQVELLDEDDLVPGMTLADLKKLPLPFFPKGAGWYFQQFLKYAFAFRDVEDDYYLIWDADTVPLRPLRFFDAQGRLLFTKANEHHEPYFQTYQRLLHEDAQTEFSFISQHLVVQKSVLREMLQRIEFLNPGQPNWAWTIMANLEGSGSNLFSEYETLGHYIKTHYPARVAFQERPWLRSGAKRLHRLPTQRDLDELGKLYAFSAFEVKERGWRGWLSHLRKNLTKRSPM
jgi:hypothetical protein